MLKKTHTAHTHTHTDSHRLNLAVEGYTLRDTFVWKYEKDPKDANSPEYFAKRLCDETDLPYRSFMCDETDLPYRSVMCYETDLPYMCDERDLPSRSFESQLQR
jgi:hypothetical protein